MKQILFYTFIVLFAGVFYISSSVAEEVDFLDDSFYEEELGIDSDPIEPFNRAMFEFNDNAYTYVIKPVTRGYSSVVPADIRGCVWNFFHNLEEPLRFINCLLQGRIEESGWVLSRFFINTICGVFGLGDPAAREFGIPVIHASLGETMAVWGVSDGFYLVVPLYGPSTLRDITGTVVDALALSPYYYWADDFLTLGTIYAIKETNKVSLNIDAYDDLKKISFDPYIAIRNGYFQNRQKLRDHSDFKVDF